MTITITIAPQNKNFLLVIKENLAPPGDRTRIRFSGKNYANHCTRGAIVQLATKGL